MTEAVLGRLASPQTIATLVRDLFVFQLWGIGDMIWTTPALGVLRKRFPGVRLTVVTNSKAETQVIQGSHLCDAVVTVGRGRKRLRPLARLAFRSRLRSGLAAVLTAGMSARLAQGLRYVGGFDHVVGGTFSNRPPGYTHWIRLSPDTHYVSLNLAIARQLCGGAGDEPLYFHIDPESEDRAARWWTEQGLTDQVVAGIHPGAGAVEGFDKRFPLDKVLFTIRRLLDRTRELQVLIYIGPDERDLAGSFGGLGPRVRVVTDVPLRVAAAVIKRTHVHAGGDSGFGHIATALGVPVVSVFGPTVPERFRPWGDGCTVVKAGPDAAPSCMPCYDTSTYGRCPIGQRCMHVVDYNAVVESVIEKAKSRP